MASSKRMAAINLGVIAVGLGGLALAASKGSRPGLVVSLYDLSGTWSEPYLQAGYEVLRIDVGHPAGLRRLGERSWTLGLDLSQPEAWQQVVQAAVEIEALDIRGVIAAPPCRVFTKAGARLWREWDRCGDTEEGLRMVEAALRIVDALQPAFWALENPPGRLWKVSGGGLMQAELGARKLSFDPWEYAGHLPDGPERERERVTKRTYLWGDFTAPERSPMEPHPYPEDLPPGRRDPMGFALAFFKANR